MLYNLHPVKVSVWSVPFDEFWHSQNHLHNQDREHFHRPRKGASCPFAPFTLSPKHPLICLLSLEISFYLFEKRIKMKSYSVSYLAFSLSTRCFWDEFRESKVSAVYSLLLLDTIPLYPAIGSLSTSWWTLALFSRGRSEILMSIHAQNFLGTYWFAFLFGRYLGVEMLVHLLSICLILKDTVPGSSW